MAYRVTLPDLLWRVPEPHGPLRTPEDPKHIKRAARAQDRWEIIVSAPTEPLTAYEIEFLRDLMQRARANPWNTRRTVDEIDRKLEAMWRACPIEEREELRIGLEVTIDGHPVRS